MLNYSSLIILRRRRKYIASTTKATMTMTPTTMPLTTVVVF